MLMAIPQQGKVLLFGESAGASNAFLISTLPNATSLLNAAIWESGAGPQLAGPATANALGGTYAARLNCSTTDVSTDPESQVNCATKPANHFLGCLS